jgi:hypothetical protein
VSFCFPLSLEVPSPSPKSIDSDEFELADILISELVVLSGKISSELMSPSRRGSIQYSGEYAESEGWQ